ncbi:MAG: hypothetical protein QM817_09535 [Archangium sp.]
MRAAFLLTFGLVALPALAQTASSVELKLTPAAPVKGRDQTAELEITLLGVDRPAPPVLRANVGQIEAVERIGAGHFKARYVLPTTRFPEVAIIVAFSPWPHAQSVEGAFGALRVPMATAVEVPGRAERNADVTLTIGGVSFGPVKSKADGTFKLPVVVPPGFGIAKTETRDRVGNKRVTSIDLALPPTDQLACVVTPTQLPADGASRARVLCASSDHYGSPTKGAKISWSGGRGTFTAPRDLGNGVTEWNWVAPRDPGTGLEKLVATWKQGAIDSSEEISIGLSQGAVAKLEVVASAEVVHRKGIWNGELIARDSLGRPLAGVSVSSARGVATTDTKGGLEVSWPVSESQALGPTPIPFVAWGPSGREPASLRAWAIDGGVGVLVSELSGLPVAGQRVASGTAVLGVTDARGLVELKLPPDATEVHHADWPALGVNLDGGLDRSRPEVAATTTVMIAAEVPVNVRAERDGAGVTWWVEGADGKILDGRKIELRDASGPHALVSRGRTKSGEARGLVSITDLESRVSAIVEVGP